MRRTLAALAIATSSWTATQPGLFEPILRLLSSLWDESATKEGCGLDPDGLCKTTPPQRQTDSGYGLNSGGSPHGGS
jgi:hypothetical protein